MTVSESDHSALAMPALKKGALVDLIGGSVAGITGKIVEFPFDTIKVRLQTQPVASPTVLKHHTSATAAMPSAVDAPTRVFNGAIDCFIKTLRSEGFFGLYKGLSSPLFGSVLENSFLFVCYGASLDAIRSLREKSGASGSFASGTTDTEPELTDVILAGAVSGAGVSFVLTPIELIKCKLQVQDVHLLHFSRASTPHSHLHPHSHTPASSVAAASKAASSSSSLGATGSGPARTYYTGPLSVVMHTLRQHGVRGMYRGHSGTFLREFGGGGAWFGVYEYIARWFVARENERHARAGGDPTKRKTKDDLRTWQLLTAGAIAGVAFNGILFPADVVKSRMQTDEEMGLLVKKAASTAESAAGATNKAAARMGFWRVAQDLYRVEGVRGFYRGFGITMARSAPASAVIFLTYETVTRALRPNMS